MAFIPPTGSIAASECVHVCMCACMHVYMYACMHVCVCACVHVCMYTCMHVYMYACMHVCMYACMHVCMYVYTADGVYRRIGRLSWIGARGSVVIKRRHDHDPMIR